MATKKTSEEPIELTVETVLKEHEINVEDDRYIWKHGEYTLTLPMFDAAPAVVRNRFIRLNRRTARTQAADFLTTLMYEVVEVCFDDDEMFIFDSLELAQQVAFFTGWINQNFTPQPPMKS